MIKGVIFDIKRFAIHDGPGIRTTVFFKGCPLACVWCHNPESQSSEPELYLRASRCIGCGACIEACPRGALVKGERGAVAILGKCERCWTCVAACYAETRQVVGRDMSVEEVIAEVERDRVFYKRSGGGVTFSGGEPLMQGEFLHALLAASRKRDLHTALDTCGLAPWETVNRIRGLVDLFLYDLKVVDETRHRELTGVSNKQILENLRKLSEQGHDICLRVAIIPGVNDNDNSLREIGALASRLHKIIEIDILPYNRMGVEKYARLGRSCPMPDAPAISNERLTEIALVLSSFGLRVKIGG